MRKMAFGVLLARRFAVFLQEPGFLLPDGHVAVVKLQRVVGAPQGVNGAVYSTIAGVTVANLIYLPHFFKKANILSLRLTRPKPEIMLQCYRTGFSSSWLVMMAIYSRTSAGL